MPQANRGIRGKLTLTMSTEGNVSASASPVVEVTRSSVHGTGVYRYCHGHPQVLSVVKRPK